MSILQRIGVILIAAALSLGYGVHWGRDHERGVQAQAHAEQVKIIEEERDLAQRTLNETAKNWAEDQARAESLARSTADRLAQSDVRLRVKLADSTIREVQGYNRGLDDGKAELHRETAEALIAITQDADRTVEALQKTLKEVTR